VEYWGATIRVNVRDDSFGALGGIAYLTDSIGMGTTQAANEQASQTFTADMFTNNWVTLFSGLHLLQGTHYLFLAPILDQDGNSDTRMLWNTTQTPTVTTAPSVYRGDLTGNLQFYADTFDSTYLPASDFAIGETDGDGNPLDGNLLFDVTVPEPSTLLLVSLAIPVCLGLRRRRAA
jgi:hypothetical protein